MTNKLIAFILASILTVGMAGCTAQTETQLDNSNAPRMLVDPNAAATLHHYGFESPSINESIVFEDRTEVTEIAVKAPKEVKAVWVSYLEMATLLKNKSKSQFTKNIRTAFDKIADLGLNTVIVQVRPFGDALYDSDYFPWSYTITGTEGKDPGFDPLAIMVAECKARDLRIEAWINPYRIRMAGNNNALSKNNPAKKWLDSGNGAVRKYNGIISYAPGSKSARELIVKGAVEIVQKYDVQAIHIDDYFYPTTDTAFDKTAYNSYKNEGGKLSLDDWRRSNVEKLIKEMYDAIKAENKNVQFGIAPQSSIDHNYDTQYLDVEKITKNSGYCDYICPQIYFGYDNAIQPYQETLDRWSELTKNSKVELRVGLAVYKVGCVDTWAGTGKNEWKNKTDLMQRMVLDAREANNYKGFVLYRYDSIFNPASDVKGKVQKETKNLKAIL